jgi:iron complex outermembrane receptor protein
LIPILLTFLLQNQPPSAPARTDTVVVTGTFDPVPLEEADRNVSSFALTPDERLLVSTPFTLLRLDSSVDVRGRAPNGVQSDVSIRGGSFGQTLVLLNGLRFNDAQSGHHNFDLPLPMDMVDRVEVLKGSGSMFYGSDAVGGVVNVLTRTPDATEIRLRSGIGSFGTNEESAVVSAVAGGLSEQLAFSRDFSTGFAPDRDYRNLSVASSTHFLTGLGFTDILLATNDRPFGADQFYGNYPSWERTRGWFAGVRQEMGDQMEAALGYRRHTDLFVLFRDEPAIFTNRHADDSWQASFRRWDRLESNTRLYYGVEGYRDSITSNNLGDHMRSRGAAYVAMDARALHRFSLTAGVREEFYGSGQTQLSPTVAAGVWLTASLKLRASASRAFRLPSFTDLYYHDPANLGSPNLKPEKAWNYEGGVEWSPSRILRMSATIFERREQDVIDYVRSSPSDIWRATNFDRLNFTGAEALIAWQPRPGQVIESRYTVLHGAENVIAGVMSKYVFNYPTENATAGYTGTLPGGFVARTSIGALKRYSRSPYAIWDASCAYTRGRVRPFVQASNLSKTNYQEIPGVAMPGRSVLGGIELIAFPRHSEPRPSGSVE